MDRDDLTPEEIEALLGTDPAPRGRPDRLSAEQIAAIQAGCHRAASRFATALSTLLRRPIEARFAALAEQNYSRFVSTREPASCSCVVAATSLEGELVLDVAGSILSPMIARLLGGDPDRHRPARRPLTEIDQRLARRIVALLVDELGAAWSQPAEERLELARVEDDPRRAGVLPASQPVVVARFELALGECRGPIGLCIPSDLAGQLAERLAAAPPSAADSILPEAAEQIGRALDDSLVEFRVELAHTRATAGELLNLAVGDVITTDQPADAPLVVELDGQTRLEVRPGIHEGQKAVQIEKRIDP